MVKKQQSDSLRSRSQIIGQKLSLLAGSLLIVGSIAPALALNDSVGEEGINARRLQREPYNLLGRKIGIGQVEIGRPKKFGKDKTDPATDAIAPKAVFFRDRDATSDNNIDDHASMVAGVMIAKNKQLQGVAPEAKLYASAVGSLKHGGQALECLASQHIALQNGGDIRAINFSFGESLARDTRKDAQLDGKALLTRCVDWSAREHDVLYAIAGNQGKGGIPIPTDNFNGITTAYTTRREGSFKKVDFANLSAFPEGIGRSVIKKEINQGLRRAISLLAPGSQISVYNQKGKREKVSGTSFAAPHITGAVALLQEHGDRLLSQSNAGWNLNARRHEVMKAILLNSADKIRDLDRGSLLNMERTIVNEHNNNWFDSDAYLNPRIPVDMQMGTGQLNVFRAYQQFDAGQTASGSAAGSLGWDYGEVEVDSEREYYLEKPLLAGSHVAITLAWDRLVELNDRDGDKRYDVGETFRDRGLNNLDVYLLPVEEENNMRNVCSSLSTEDSVEHIFCPIPKTERYKIRVHYRYQHNKPIQPYALAWWTSK